VKAYDLHNVSSIEEISLCSLHTHICVNFSCNFDTKLRNAQDRNAAAMIVYDSEERSYLEKMGLSNCRNCKEMSLSISIYMYKVFVLYVIVFYTQILLLLLLLHTLTLPFDLCIVCV
jgi:UDP-2,3-diacylglucosamine pyrophosphatase LpxH